MSELTIPVAASQLTTPTPIFRTPDYIKEPLYVIVAIFNPIRYKSRWKHLQRFVEHAHAAGAVVYVIEASFRERHHALDGIAPDNDIADLHARTGNRHTFIRVNTTSEVWFKENLQNVAARYLPHDWKYMATVDGDVMFTRPNWVGETIHQLQHFPVVQMFSQVQDLDSNYNVLQSYRGFVDCYQSGLPTGTRPDTGGCYYTVPPDKKGPHAIWHPGFAWAYRRDAFDALGGLIDFAVLGSGDRHMACALIGCVEESVHPNVNAIYRDRLLEWQWRADRYIRRNVGVVSGLIVHYWHGAKVNRRYKDRWRILVDNQYNPNTDVKYDWQGLLQLVDRGEQRSIDLRDQIMRYFRERNEDALSS